MTTFKLNIENLEKREINDLSKNDELNFNEIKIIKRTLDNNTHEVFEDERLKSITSWRKSKSKFYKTLIFNILTLGILHLVSLYYPNLYIKLYCNPWPAKECDFFLVENIYGQLTLCIKNHRKEKRNNSINNDNTQEKIINISSDCNISNNLTYSFKYKSMKYEYKLEKNEIIPVYMNLSKMTNKALLNFFADGISSQNLAKKIEERYGKNEYYINPNLIILYFMKVQSPTLIIIICIGIGEIILKDFNSFIFKSIFIFLIIFNEFLYAKYTVYNIYKKENTLDGENKIKVKRKYLYKNKNELYIEINNKDLLPGDILFLKKNDMVPCDCLILEGECIVNQNHSNGSLDLIKKISIINNNEIFNYKLNYNSILLHGMKIINIFSKIKEQYISVLCLNTGPNTYKANQYSNILYSTERKKGYKDVYQFIGDDRKSIIIAIFVLFFTCIFLGIGYMFILNMPRVINILKYLIISCILRTLFKSLMSVYYITHTIILLISLFHLKTKNIFCYDKCRLLHSYNIDKIFISKSNIISENSFEVNTYNPIYINNQKSNNISYNIYKENQCKEMNIELLKYYKKYISICINKTKDVKQEIRNSQIFRNNTKNKNKIYDNINKYVALFIECLLSCNNIEKKNNEIFGNIIETKIFYNMKWDIKTYDYNYFYNQDNNNKNKIKEYYNYSNNNNLNYKCKYSYENNYNSVYTKISDIFPKNYYKITEDLKRENKYNNNNNFMNKSFMSDDKSSQNSKNLNPILKDISKTNINSYILRIYKRFIKEGTLISSAIIYNFITKELRFMTKGIPEDILNKCDKNTYPENFEKIISIIRMNGYIIIICATKLIDINEYNDNNGIDYYMNNLTFCGFITLKSKIKSDIKNSINELKNIGYNLILTSGDNLFNCICDGYKSGIIENNKNIFVVDKDEQNKILIHKFFDIKNLNKEENENLSTNYESLDKYSKKSKKILSRQQLGNHIQNDTFNKGLLENTKDFSKNEEEEEEKVEILSRTPQIFFKSAKNNKVKYNMQNFKRGSVKEIFKFGNIEYNIPNILNRNLKYKKIKNIKINESEIRSLVNTDNLEQKKISNKNFSPEYKGHKNNIEYSIYFFTKINLLKKIKNIIKTNRKSMVEFIKTILNF